MVNPTKYLESCATKNAPTGEAIKAAKELAQKAKEEAAKLTDEAYKAAHATFKNTKEIGADELAEAYKAAHGIV